MKNILLIMPYGSVGGMERLALTFYNHYKSEGHSVKVLKLIKLDSDIINFGDDELYLSRIDFSGMSAFKRMLFYLNAPLRIRKIINQTNTTHSISFGDMANIFSSLTGTKENKTASIHALKSVEFSAPTFLNKVFKLGFSTSYHNFDKVVCISNAIKIDLIQNCGFKFKDKLQVIYNPHNVDTIISRSNEAFHDQVPSLFEDQTILFLGRISLQKSPWHLVKAFSLLLKDRPNLKLIFIGDGEASVEAYVDQLMAELQLQQNVIFLGRQQNPYPYLKRASVLALSSKFEGTPNVIVEAIALGIPVVTSNCTDGISEIMAIAEPQKEGDLLITESGIITPTFYKNDLSIPTDNTVTGEERRLAAALDMVLSSTLYKERVGEARSQLLQKFNLEAVAAAYLK